MTSMKASLYFQSFALFNPTLPHIPGRRIGDTHLSSRGNVGKGMTGLLLNHLYAERSN
jgi:hypothetical protein